MDLTRELYGETYIIRTPIIATLTEDDLNSSGVFINDDEGKPSKSNHEEFTIVGKTIFQMAEIHSNGYPIYLINPSDMKIIYKILNDYIHTSNSKSNYSPNVVYNQEDDVKLMMLDRLAQEMFDINGNDVLEKVEKKIFGFENNNKFNFLDKFEKRREDPEVAYIRSAFKPNKAVNVSDLLK